MSNNIKKCYVVVHTIEHGDDYESQVEALLIKSFLCKKNADEFAERFSKHLNTQKPSDPFKWNNTYKFWANENDYVQVEEVDFDDAVE